jgi:plasmid stabilization system protein ParE
MRIRWTRKASSDLVRLHEHLRPVAPDAAARVVQQLARAPDRLLDHPRIGEKLEAYAPREVRRIMVGHYELRYEIADATIFVLRLWHSRESRSVEQLGPSLLRTAPAAARSPRPCP